jgi:hypothetical protein
VTFFQQDILSHSYSVTAVSQWWQYTAVSRVTHHSWTQGWSPPHRQGIFLSLPKIQPSLEAWQTSYWTVSTSSFLAVKQPMLSICMSTWTLDLHSAVRCRNNFTLFMYVNLWVYCTLTEVFLNLTEVFPCFFLSCKANATVKLAKMGHGPHSSTLVVICVVRLLFVLFHVLFVCKCVLPPGDNPIAVHKYIIYPDCMCNYNVTFRTDSLYRIFSNLIRTQFLAIS